MLRVRTSTKLLVFIVFCVFLSPVVFNYLMKREFDKGKFILSHRQKINFENYSVTYNVTDLATFHHVVIDGVLKGYDGKVVTENIVYWRPRILITDEQGPNLIEVPRKIGNNTSFSVVNDTLYVRFDTKEKFARDHELKLTFHIAYIKVNASRLNSLVGVNANIYLKGNFDNTGVYLSHGLLTLNKANINKLNIRADDNSKIKIDRFSKVDQLAYSFCNSTAYLAKGTVSQFAAGPMNGATKINIVDTLGNTTTLTK